VKVDGAQTEYAASGVRLLIKCGVGRANVRQVSGFDLCRVKLFRSVPPAGPRLEAIWTTRAGRGHNGLPWALRGANCTLLEKTPGFDQLTKKLTPSSIQTFVPIVSRRLDYGYSRTA